MERLHPRGGRLLPVGDRALAPAAYRACRHRQLLSSMERRTRKGGCGERQLAMSAQHVGKRPRCVGVGPCVRVCRPHWTSCSAYDSLAAGEHAWLHRYWPCYRVAVRERGGLL